MKQLQTECSSLSVVRDKVGKEATTRTGKGGTAQFVKRNGVLYRLWEKGGRVRKQVVVPAKLRGEVLIASHDGLMGAHLRTKNTLERIQEHIYWPGIK